ncbi:MAG: NADPH-dependent oxidoreductase [Burkholderiaceae bacterium]|nr:NADPH-dependent oxidoreductase [Burkholderiaceae bacterium]
MNAALEVLLAHRSYRDYTDQPVSDADLEAIIAAAQRAPSSIHAQLTSLIVVRDPAKRAKIAEIAGGQPWIAKAPVFICLVADFAKTQAAVEYAGEKQVIHESLEGFAVAAVDTGIVLTTLTTAAHALGLGAVMIGGIRNDPQAMIDLLGLPPLTFPFIGCCIGHFASEPPLKPRLPVSTFRHDEQWHGVPDKATIEAYNAELMAYWQSIGRTDGQSWTANTARRYKTVYFPNVKPVAVKQGLKAEK